MKTLLQANLRHAVSPGKIVALQAQVHIKEGKLCTLGGYFDVIMFDQ